MLISFFDEEQELSAASNRKYSYLHPGQYQLEIKLQGGSRTKSDDGRLRPPETGGGGTMHRFVLAVTAFLVATAVSAADSDGIYNGFSTGNPDLFSDSVSKDEVTAMQPRIGGNVDVYRGFEVGNPDLFTSPDSQGERFSASPDVYHGFEIGNSDLR